MDILIKNIEMPKSCDDCFACHECSYESYDYCNILKTMTTRGERRKDCPLIALPPHERLIDEAKLRERAYAIQRRDRISFTDALAMALIEAETIVEASE